MKRPATSLHTFVIRIWLEEHADESEPAVWRGSIVHVISDEKRSITDLQQAVRFIESYLPAGVPKSNARPRIYRWIARLKER